MDAVRGARGAIQGELWLALLAALGLYLTLAGYRSFEGDQAYRLPLLLRAQNPALFVDDPFVRSFDEFNPHRGALALVGWVSALVGLPAALFVLFAATFLVTAFAVRRLAVAVWPEAAVGTVAVGLFLMTKAGNIGTNHVFEPILLDRLMALALGWMALGDLLEGRPRAVWTIAIWVVAAQAIHPSLGLQIGALAAASWLVLGALRRLTGVPWRNGILGATAVFLGLLPSLAMLKSQSDALFDGLDRDTFLTLSAWIQSPQHMLPHLWRMSQWLAFGCFPVLGVLAIVSDRRARRGMFTSESVSVGPGRRLVVVLGVCFAMLAAAAMAIEGLHDARATLFQPFRLATLARGLCVILLAGHVLELWRRGGAWGQIRALLLGLGLMGDWTLVVVSSVELGTALLERRWPRAAVAVGVTGLVAGSWFLARHDTESGQWRILAGVVVGLTAGAWWPWVCGIPWTRARRLRVLAIGWLVPLAALGAGLLGDEMRSGQGPGAWLASRWRIVPRPEDEMERLALWCREHTPVDARFIGPPGPKTFRLWAERSLAFNRAGSPYHARGLSDWFGRFRDHVAFDGDTASFIRAYLAGRHDVEARYDALSSAELHDLALRQSAGYVIARPRQLPSDDDRFALLHAAGSYSVFRVAEGGAELADLGNTQLRE